MTIKHHFTIVCDDMMRDESGRMAFFGSFINVELEKIPGSLSHMCVAIGFEGDPGDKFSIDIEDPDGKMITCYSTGTIQRSPVTPPHKVVMVTVWTRFKPMTFRKEGRYWVTLRGGRRVIHKRPIGVIKKQPDPKGKISRG